MANKPKRNYAGSKNKVTKIDVCQTPPHALEPILPYLNKHWIIWESAVGPERLLETALLTRGYQVIGTDLLDGDYYNFFYYAPTNWDVQVTNCPFSIKYDWFARSFELHKPFAILAPTETIAAAKFKTLVGKYNNNPWFIEVLSPERRINYKMPNVGWGKEVWSEEKGYYYSGGSAQMHTCWITWGLDIWKTRDDFLRTYYVPMRSVKYDENNQPIERKQR